MSYCAWEPRPFRTYLLRGKLHCACGTRMRGMAHVQRGTERRYYRCHSLGCRSRRAPADLVEGEILAAISELALPDEVIQVAREELRRRLETPEAASVGRQRERLTKRLEQLKKQHGWGDLPDEEYMAKRDAVKATLATLPDGDRIASFDAFRAQVLALPQAIAVASPARREELCQLVVDRVVVRDRVIERIEWTPAARPFFEKRERWCPQGDSNP